MLIFGVAKEALSNNFLQFGTYVLPLKRITMPCDD